MVSVIIPTYNREKTILKSAKSVLCQTYKDLELIIVDDGSDDRTREIVSKIKDSRVRYIYQENSGACVARNNGISCAKGEYIAFQDSDDRWHRDKLEKQIKILENNPDVDIVCCKTKCIRLNGSAFTSMDNLSEGIIPRKTGPQGISTQALVMRRRVTDAVKFDKKVTRYQDLDFMLTAYKKFTVYCVAEPLVDRFIGDDSITNKPERIYDMARYLSKKHSDACRELPSLNKFFAAVLMQAGWEVRKSGGNERKYYSLSMKFDSSFKAKLRKFGYQTGMLPLYKKLRNFI